MKTIIEDSNFDTKLEASDWRYSASIVGLIKYFDYHQLCYHQLQTLKHQNYMMK